MPAILDPEDNHVRLAPRVRRALEAYCEAEDVFVTDVLNKIVREYLAKHLKFRAATHLPEQCAEAAQHYSEVQCTLRALDIVQTKRTFVRDGKTHAPGSYVQPTTAVQIKVRATTTDGKVRECDRAAQSRADVARVLADALLELNGAAL